MKKGKRIAIITAGTLFLISGCGNGKETNNSDDNDSNNLSVRETIPDKEIPNLETTDEVDISTSNTNGYTNCNDEIYVSVNSNFRTDATVADNIIEVIGKCQKVHRISTNEDWDFLEYDGKTGFVKSDCTEVLPESYIEVDIDAQKIYLYKDEDLLLSSDIVSGKNSTPTRIGFFNIKSKSKNVVLRGPGYASPVKYWMPFDNGIGLHDAPWRDTFGGTIYKESGSHGCVNLPFETVYTIYNNYSVGDKVLVHK